MNTLSIALRQTLQSGRLLWLIYGITLILALLVALPFYNTVKVEDQNSLAFLNLLNGFDYTVFSDFMHRSGNAISPLVSVGRWLGALYLFLSIFFAGGILLRFSQPNPPFNVGMFWQGCSHYVGRFLRLFGVTLIFVIVGAGLWLVVGSLVAVSLNHSLSERGQFWIGLVFFILFALTAAFLLCVGDYAKVIMFQEDEQNAFRAYGQAGRFVRQHIARTFGLYCLLILIGTGLLGVYFLIDDMILMSNWLTIFVMFLVQQVLIFARVGLKVWSLGITYIIGKTRPQPAPILRPIPVSESIPDLSDEPPLNSVES